MFNKPDKVIEPSTPLHTEGSIELIVKVGNGLTVKVKGCVCPEQPLSEGVTVTLDSCWVTVVAAVKVAMSPVPLVVNPVAVLLLTQLKAALVVPTKDGTTTELPEQVTILIGAVTSGMGLTVIVNDWFVPAQPFNVGITLMLETMGLVTICAINAAISPVPLAVKPVVMLSFVHENVAPVLPLNTIGLDKVPEQTIASEIAAKVGKGFTVNVNV